MGVFADLKRRTGVGIGGVVLYVGALVGLIALASTRGEVHGRGNPLEFLTGLVFAAGLLGIVAAVSNAPRLALVSLARRRGAVAGLQAFTGTIQTAGGTLTGPVSESEVVCYTVRVLGNDHDDDPDPDEEKNWTLVETVQGGVPFSLVTDSGERVRVDPSASMLAIDGSQEVFVDIDGESPDGIQSFRRDADVPPADGDEARRYQESALAPGDRAFVLGHAAEEGALTISGGSRFVVADEGYPSRVEGRVVTGLLGGVPVTVLGFLAFLFVTNGL